MDWNIEKLLDRLQTHDECVSIEAKRSKTTLGKSVLETISAFSNEPNLGGGYLVLGLERNTKSASDIFYTICGVDGPDKIQCELASICRSKFNIPIRPEIKVQSYHENTLIVAFIPEVISKNKPVFIKSLGVEKGAFRRIGSADHRCTAEDLDLLYQLRSACPYESEVLPYSEWQDIDIEALAEYRRQRSEIDPNASELRLSDEELLLSLGGAIRKNEGILPTVAGLLLFGSKTALRRLMPMGSRVDYILAEGTEWIQDPSARFHTIDFREPLIYLMPRLHTQIMSGLPKRFSLREGDIQRSDIPSVPRDVIREALANALMHRDYRIGQPTQIICYSNRIEFRNAGYSLKPFEELGEPGSKTRNMVIAALFHELKYAETKGTGIRAMREWMKSAGLTTPPIIETDRDRNEFDLVLLPHHLLDRNNLEWLSRFKGFSLSDAERRALVFAREIGAITNQDYRQINGTETLTASKALGHLRDLELLTMKGTGSTTYYTLEKGAIGSFSSNDKHKGATPYINPLYKGLNAIPKGFPSLSNDLKKEIVCLGNRCSKDQIKFIIRRLCSLAPLKPSQLGKILDRDTQYLRINFLSKMIVSGELVYLYPKQPAHPKQAYKVPVKDEMIS